jgi:hypothetical protein
MKERKILYAEEGAWLTNDGETFVKVAFLEVGHQGQGYRDATEEEYQKAEVKKREEERLLEWR